MAKILTDEWFISKLPKWIYKSIKKIRYNRKHGIFNYPAGIYTFCGKQGKGKTLSAVNYIRELKARYGNENVYVVSNIDTIYNDSKLNSLDDLFTVRNPKEGALTVFFIDEIQNELSSLQSKNFNEGLLIELTQQRKQKVHIITTTQVFMRMAKPLREQSFLTIECWNLFGIWFFNRAFDSWEYEAHQEHINDETKRHRLHREWAKSFIADNETYNSFDTFEKVKRLGMSGALERDKRLQS